MRYLTFGVFVLMAILFFGYHTASIAQLNSAPITSSSVTLWQVQSIDTMKYSRDLAREKINDPSFDQVIDQQVHNIADTGATHIALDTPYDREFLPMLKRWVAAARRYHLAVWFRGNWSGWEGWFDYAPISQATHIIKTKKFITDNPSLFNDNDIFTACPECENGGPGDPRTTGGVSNFRHFLIALDAAAKQSFADIHRQVQTGYYSMNGDVARLVMDTSTVWALDNRIVVDHYVRTPKQLSDDLRTFSLTSPTVVLGEFGAPIPDIHGEMTEHEQALWIEQALDGIARVPAVTGVNYWVNVGGSTALWSATNQPTEAVNIFRRFFSPSTTSGVVIDERGIPVAHASVQTSYRTTFTDQNGFFVLPYVLGYNPDLIVSANGYTTASVKLTSTANNLSIRLVFSTPSLKIYLIRIFRSIINLLPGM